jgi:general secretion pathway protein E
LPHGMVLVTGPTGSGKSTTLYAALDKTDKMQRKVITVEDPVEYQMEGISQIQMNAPIGLTFARGLRSILRHDPDIILVGEIRDHETAEIAIRSALTGHLVLSTLHTNDAVGAITRLVDMDVDPFLVSSSLVASIAQRLVRKNCTECAEEIDPKSIPERTREEIARTLRVPETEVKALRGKGCHKCGNSGYKGRLGIFEIFLMDNELEDMITRGSTSVEIRDNARNKGMHNLRTDGWRKVMRGQTSIDEILRITTAFDLRYDL